MMIADIVGSLVEVISLELSPVGEGLDEVCHLALEPHPKGLVNVCLAEQRGEGDRAGIEGGDFLLPASSMLPWGISGCRRSVIS